MLFNNLTNFFNGIRKTSGGFTMDGGQMGNGGIRFQGAVDLIQVGGLIFGASNDGGRNLEVFGHGHHAFPISAIGQEKQFAIGRDRGSEHGLHPKTAAALHENQLKTFLTRQSSLLQEFLAELADQVVEIQCQEPASCNMACLTDKLVVKGPGIKSSLSLAAEIWFGSFIGPRLYKGTICRLRWVNWQVWV